MRFFLSLCPGFIALISTILVSGKAIQKSNRVSFPRLLWLRVSICIGRYRPACGECPNHERGADDGNAATGIGAHLHSVAGRDRQRCEWLRKSPCQYSPSERRGLNVPFSLAYGPNGVSACRRGWHGPRLCDGILRFGSRDNEYPNLSGPERQSSQRWSWELLRNSRLLS